jgi:hypothetical protein
MRVAFISSAYRTIVARELAIRFERAGHSVFWLSPNRRWARWLVEHAIEPGHILDITEHAHEWLDGPGDTTADRAELHALERKSGWKIHDLIASDNLLSRRDTDHAVRYCAASARHARRFLEQHAIELITGEMTWAFEQIVAQVCIDLGIPFVRPMDVRIPNDRTGFFRDRKERDMVELRATTDADRTEARALLKAYREKPRQPAYMSINPSVLRANRERIKLLTKHAVDLARDPQDATSRRPLGLIVDHSTQVLRTLINGKLGSFEMPEDPPKRPFVLVTLHLQPEMTIDVMASPLCNQIATTEALARTLPVTHDLYVKEHIVALGKRKPSVYSTLRAIPGVRLIDPRAHTFRLIQQASLVVAATGTAAYEASLLGRPAVTMAPTVFSPIVVSDRFNPFVDSLGDTIERCAGRNPHSDERIVEFLAWLLAQTVPCAGGDALWQPYAMEPTYLDRVAQGFFTLFASLSAPANSRSRGADAGWG